MVMERNKLLPVMDELTQAPHDEDCGLWHVLHVKSRQEKALADDLAVRGISYFLPLVRHQRVYGRRKAVIEVPLFPGYLFLQGDLEQAYDADRTGRVARIIPVADQGRLARELASVRMVVEQDGPLDPYPYLKEGLPVRVRSGPLEGLEGLIESKYKRDRLIIQVDVLGQGVSMEIDGACLELL